jgi:UDP-galactopyranose mutase
VFTGPIDAFYASQGLAKLEYRSIYWHKVSSPVHSVTPVQEYLEPPSGYFQPAWVVNYPGGDVGMSGLHCTVLESWGAAGLRAQAGPSRAHSALLSNWPDSDWTRISEYKHAPNQPPGAQDLPGTVIFKEYRCGIV